MRISSARIFLTAALLIFLGACTALQPDFETPDVTVTGFRPARGDTGGLNFEIDLRVANPNRDALDLKGIAYTVWLEDRKLITGVGKDLPTVEGYSEETFTLTATTSVFEVIQLMGDLMGEPRDNLNYRLESKLDIGALYPPIRVTDEGQVSLVPPTRNTP